MPGKQGETLLKVCHTCQHWSYRYKGYCARLNQGVGRFWMCEEWTEAPAAKNPPEEGPPAGAVPPA
jgi:hypothetical protein